jgi:hypothetical protein
LANRRRALIAALSVGGHLVVVLALLGAQPEPPATVELAPMSVTLVQVRPEPPPRPPEAPAPERPAPPIEVPPAPAPPPTRIRARPAPAPPDVVSLPASDVATKGDPGAEMSDAQLAGATIAGSGGVGGGCNMPRRLQSALRKDRHVQAAVAEAHRGRALRVWNGDWVRHAGQEGAGLAAVREAIMWEVAFAPEACRSEPVHGLIVISLNDGPGAARLAVGSGRWRWKDLLFSGSSGSSPR